MESTAEDVDGFCLELVDWLLSDVGEELTLADCLFGGVNIVILNRDGTRTVKSLTLHRYQN